MDVWQGFLPHGGGVLLSVGKDAQAIAAALLRGPTRWTYDPLFSSTGARSTRRVVPSWNHVGYQFVMRRFRDIFADENEMLATTAQ